MLFGNADADALLALASAKSSVDHFFDDEPVPGTQGVSHDLLKQIEPFPTTTDLKPYDPAFLSGWVVDHREAVLANDALSPAIVLVSHHVEEIPPGFTHALVLRHGAVIASGPTEQLTVAPSTLTSLTPAMRSTATAT